MLSVGRTCKVLTALELCTWPGGAGPRQWAVGRGAVTPGARAAACRDERRASHRGAALAAARRTAVHRERRVACPPVNHLRANQAQHLTVCHPKETDC